MGPTSVRSARKKGTVRARKWCSARGASGHALQWRCQVIQLSRLESIFAACSMKTTAEPHVTCCSDPSPIQCHFAAVRRLIRARCRARWGRTNAFSRPTATLTSRTNAAICSELHRVHSWAGTQSSRPYPICRQAKSNEPIAAEDDEKYWGDGAGEKRDAASSKSDEADGDDERRDCFDTSAELDVDDMVRKEMQWLKSSGYLAGNASFHLVRLAMSTLTAPSLLESATALSPGRRSCAFVAELPLQDRSTASARALFLQSMSQELCVLMFPCDVRCAVPFISPLLSYALPGVVLSCLILVSFWSRHCFGAAVRVPELRRHRLDTRSFAPARPPHLVARRHAAGALGIHVWYARGVKSASPKPPPAP